MLPARLQILESRLQHLFEEQLARLLPGEEERSALQKQMVLSLQASLRRTGGRVPKRLRISLSPPFSAAYRHNPALQAAVEHSILQALQQSGLEWETPPKIEVLADAALPGSEVHLVIPETGPLGQTEAVSALPAGRPASKPAPGEAFLIIGGRETYPITHSITNIGRRPDNDLVIDDPRVSRRHAQLRAEGERYYLFDLNATGGTFVNGLRIHQKQLRAGDVISLAGFPLVFGVENAPAPGETQEYTPHSPAS